MHLLRLDFTAQTDLIFSAIAGTAGQHECLDYIPGSAIWGAVAARFYGKWASAGDWEKVRSLFHSGKVRFGIGVPASPHGGPLRPIPFAWHSKKDHDWSERKEAGDADEILATELRNLSRAQWNFVADGQPEQVRSGWFDAAGAFVTVNHRHRLKTAIDPDQFDSPSDGQLFGYSSIPAETRFVALIEADPTTPGWNEVKEYLCQAKSLRLGRSRSAEFGEVTLQATEAADDGWPVSSPVGSDAKQAVLHLLSDLVLSDSSGVPQLHPTPELLGLGQGKTDLSRSHLRFRAYSPWNRFRGCHDTERQVIAAGSVIALDLEQPPQTARLVAGLYQAEGLGQMVVNPDYLATPEISFRPASTNPIRQKEAHVVPPPEKDPVYLAMTCRYADSVLEQLSVALGRQWADEWANNCRHVSKSQWARLRQTAVLSTTTKDLQARVQALGEGNLSADKYWNKTTRVGSETPLQVVRRSLEATQTIKDNLQAEGLAEHDPAGRDLAALLAIYATREATIAISREKSKSLKKEDRS